MQPTSHLTRISSTDWGSSPRTPNLMEAANRGARGAGATRCNIRLVPRAVFGRLPDISPRFEHPFPRKVMFVRYARGFVIGLAATVPSTSCSQH